MKKLFHFGLLVLLTSGFTQAQNTWLKNFGSTKFEYMDAVATDDSGNVYVAGRMAANMVIGDTTLTKVGSYSYSYFLAKYTSAGNFRWATTVGVAPNIELVSGIAVDHNFNVYMSINDPGTLFKFDQAGNLIYQKTIQSWKPRLGNVLVDDSNYVWICGSFSQYNFSLDGLPAMPHNGGTSLYIAKLDTTGTAKLVMPIGSNSISTRMGKIALRDSLVYFTANTYYDVYIGNDTFNNANITTGCFNKNGTYKWAKIVTTPPPSTSLDYIYDIAVTSDHQVVIAGQFYNPISVSGLVLSNANNKENFFIASYNSKGTILWAKKSNTIYCSAKAISVTPDDKIAVAADYAFSFSYDALTVGDGVNGKRFAVLLSINKSGNVEWLKSLGQSDWTYTNALATDKQGNWFLGGNYQATTTNTIDGKPLTVVGESDVYFIKNFYLPQAAGSANYSFCKDGTPTQLVASGVGVKWYADSALTQLAYSGTNFTIQLDSVATYYVVQTQGGAKSATKKVSAILHDLNPVSLTSQNDTLYVNPAKGKQYSWYKNGALLAGKNAAYLAVTSSGNYHALMIDSNSCKNYTDTLAMQVTGLSESSTFDVEIYPNPANNLLQFKANENITEVAMYNTSGALVYQQKDVAINQCNLTELPDGLYLIQLKTRQSSLVKRIVIHHQ
jgi:hypothetical protein